MPGDLRVVASFATPVEADVLRMRLEAEGIRSVLADESTVGMNWMLGNAVGGVKVLVIESDLEAALQIAEDQAAEASDQAKTPAEDWTCVVCGEKVEGGFEVCWSCGASREGESDAEFQREPAEESHDHAEDGTAVDGAPEDAASFHPPDVGVGSANPYSSPLAPLKEPPEAAKKVEEELDTEEGDAIAERAWRASVLGLVYCPPFMQIYSTGLLLTLALNDTPLSRKAARRSTIAWAVNVGVAAAVGISIASFIRYGG